MSLTARLLLALSHMLGGPKVDPDALWPRGTIRNNRARLKLGTASTAHRRRRRSRCALCGPRGGHDRLERHGRGA